MQILIANLNSDKTLLEKPISKADIKIYEDAYFQAFANISV